MAVLLLAACLGGRKAKRDGIRANPISLPLSSHGGSLLFRPLKRTCFRGTLVQLLDILLKSTAGARSGHQSATPKSEDSDVAPLRDERKRYVFRLMLHFARKRCELPADEKINCDTNDCLSFVPILCHNVSGSTGRDGSSSKAVTVAAEEAP